MKTRIGWLAVLASVMGMAAEAAAMGENDSAAPGKRGLSPIMQAAPAGATPQPDYILKLCKETESAGDPRSAMRAVDPAGMFAIYLQNHDNRTVDAEMLAAIKTTLLEGTKHGNIFAAVDNTGRTSYHYDPIPEYVGNDRAVFMAEFEGKRYKIVLDLRVFTVVDENNPTCPSPQLIKVNGKPVSGWLIQL